MFIYCWTVYIQSFCQKRRGRRSCPLIDRALIFSASGKKLFTLFLTGTLFQWHRVCTSSWAKATGTFGLRTLISSTFSEAFSDGRCTDGAMLHTGWDAYWLAQNNVTVLKLFPNPQKELQENCYFWRWGHRYAFIFLNKLILWRRISNL